MEQGWELNDDKVCYRSLDSERFKSGRCKISCYLGGYAASARQSLTGVVWWREGQT